MCTEKFSKSSFYNFKAENSSEPELKNEHFSKFLVHTYGKNTFSKNVTGDKQYVTGNTSNVSFCAVGPAVHASKGGVIL